jgi:hypothetical protein
MKQVIWLLAAVALGGCAHKQAPNEAKQEALGDTSPVMEAKYSHSPVKVDGKLDDPVWQQATRYTLHQPADVALDGRCEDPGTIRFAWDDKYFYLAVDFKDKDLQAHGDKDGMHHYQYGDVAELFLKPDNSTWYWELYVTPAGKQTRFFIPGRGLLGMQDLLVSEDVLKTAAQIEGTLNDWKDTDLGWTGEMAVPLGELTRLGDHFDPRTPWRVFAARYNYSRYRQLKTGPELSSAPMLNEGNWHLLEGYARLKLVR